MSLHNVTAVPESILQIADKLVSDKRAREYGSFRDNANRALNAYRAFKGSSTIEGVADFALLMVCFKLGREASRPKRDNRVDACGYLKLMDEIVEGGHLAEKKEEKTAPAPLPSKAIP